MGRLIAGIVGAIIITVGALPDSACADLVQWVGNGHWYEAVYVGSPGISWTDARDAATRCGGYLATITSDPEDNFVYSLVSEDKYWWLTSTGCGAGPWLGGYQYDHAAEPAGDWRWVSDEPWTYTNWATGEPNNDGGDEQYLSFMAYNQVKGPTWNDNTNSAYPLFGYVVEYNSVPEPSTAVLLGLGAITMLANVWRAWRGA